MGPDIVIKCEYTVELSELQWSKYFLEDPEYFRDSQLNQELNGSVFRKMEEQQAELVRPRNVSPLYVLAEVG